MGVNAFEEEQEPPIAIFRPPAQAQERQIAKLKALKENRDNDKVHKALAGVADAARQGINTVPALVDAVEAYASIGEICKALGEVYGYHSESGL